MHRVAFLLAAAIGVFFLHTPLHAGIAAASLAALWLAVGLGARRLARQIVKLLPFAAFVIASYALVPEDAGDTLETGVVMVLRVVSVVMASQVARAGDPRAIAHGLRRLGMPERAATTLDVVLALVGGGGGGGGGGGRHRGPGEVEGETFLAAVKRIARGDVDPIVGRIERQIARAERHEARPAGDVPVIAGVSLTMLGVKALKVLPSIPFAPGHKLVILTPLYAVASLMTAGRAGATLTGLTMGTVAFLMGDGKYGVFEILKHVTPGVLTDLMVPVLTAGGRRPGAVAWCVYGGLVGAGRFATIFAITFLVQAPSVAYAILVPGLCVHVGFGVVSGWVTRPLVAALDRAQHERELRRSET